MICKDLLDSLVVMLSDFVAPNVCMYVCMYVLTLLHIVDVCMCAYTHTHMHAHTICKDLLNFLFVLWDHFVAINVSVYMYIYIHMGVIDL